MNAEVIRGRERPLAESGGTAILYGSLAPGRSGDQDGGR